VLPKNVYQELATLINHQRQWVNLHTLVQAVLRGVKAEDNFIIIFHHFVMVFCEVEVTLHFQSEYAVK
jgi:hypothetical protein